MLHSSEYQKQWKSGWCTLYSEPCAGNVILLPLELLQNVHPSALELELLPKTLITLTGSLTCYYGNKFGSYRNLLHVTGGAIKRVCLNNCTLLIRLRLRTCITRCCQHQPSFQELLILRRGKEPQKGGNNFSSL